MTNIIESIRAEYLRYKGLAEGAIDQLVDDDLSAPGLNGGNSIATICWHVSGNLKSRFTEFLTGRGVLRPICYARGTARKMERGLESPARHSRRPHRRAARPDRDNSRSASSRAPGASPFPCPHQLSRWPDRLPRQGNARKGLEVPQHRARSIGRLYSDPVRHRPEPVDRQFLGALPSRTI